MTLDPTRRGLLRIVTLAGISAIVLPGKALLPAAQAASPNHSPPPSPATVNGWLIKASDR